MRRFLYYVLLFLTVSLCALSLTSCGSEGDGDATEWTVRTGDLSLTETLRISGGEAFYFGEIEDVAVAPNGRIYVADSEAHHIKVFGPDGIVVDTIGRKGEEPGEFQRPSEIVVTRFDSLYVLDPFRGKISVFTPTEVFARSRSVTLGLRTVVLVPPSRSGMAYARVVPFAGDEDVGYMVSGLGPGTADTILTAQRAETYTPAGTNASHPIPYSPHSFVSMGPDGLVHFVRGDSLTVTRYDFRGRRRGLVRVPFEPVPVSESDRERVLKRLRDARPISEGRLPDVKPAAEDFFVDYEGRYWFGRPTAHPDSTDWWVADSETKRVVTGTLPRDVQLEVVKDGRAYGRSETEAGAPVVVRYDVSIER